MGLESRDLGMAQALRPTHYSETLLCLSGPQFPHLYNARASLDHICALANQTPGKSSQWKGWGIQATKGGGA
jgi:hypothetical protein